MIETTGDDRRIPPALAAVAQVEFDCDDGEGVDFEPYDAFDSAEETTDWIRNWTDNHELDGDAYRVFGQDGTGGLVALWCVRPGRPLAEQPVVFLGSEGERGVVAGNLSDFLWLLADGLGPMEVVEYEQREARPNPALAELAERHATTARRPARDIITEAQAEFPSFSEDLDKLCR
ncbi:SMI1/KNR4 family protein [Streptomyces scabiei]|uniref:SMI1/KNR4 family protein n=1 Tax=Streptomyces scabiei TaxID=1930 RepID=UPI0029B274B6|nr:SMI1/KNR4 family protein [Streptomyces scabiei]MDX3524781.1 SMI1/KNR4 family protein [Streptomyces scabiei]